MPMWGTISQTQAQINQYKSDLAQAGQAMTKANQLFSTYQSISSQQKSELQNFLPTSISQIDLAMWLNALASQYGSGLSSLSLGTSETSPGQSINILPVSFSVTMTYSNFLLFLKALQQGSPVTDVTSLSFTPPQTGNLYTFSVSLQTYYL